VPAVFVIGEGIMNNEEKANSFGPPAGCEASSPSPSRELERSLLLEKASSAEKEGLLDEAITLYNQFLLEHPDDRDVLLALAELRLERGEEDRARMLLERLEALGDLRAKERLKLLSDEQPASEETTPDDSAPPSFSAADLVLFCDLFAGRLGVHARQWSTPDGRYGYAPVMATLTPALVRQHLLGACTLGVYPVDSADRVRFLALDIDIDTPPEQLPPEQRQELRSRALQLARRIQEEIAAAGFDPLLEESGYKGYHLWVFFEDFWPAAKARKLARYFASCAGENLEGLHVEVFPAQDRVKKGGLGNLIKLPLGLHLKSSSRSQLLDREGKILVSPFLRLRQLRRAGLEELEQVLAHYQDRWRIREEDQKERSRPEPKNASEEEPSLAASCVPVDPPWKPEQDEEFQFLVERCLLLRGLVEKALTVKRLTHQEQAALRYTIGHLSRGAEAVNYIFEQAGCLDSSSRMVSNFRGNPASCNRLRARLKVPQGQSCNCQFEPTLGHYPTPLLHLAALQAQKKIIHLQTEDNTRELLREYHRIKAEKERLERLAQELEKNGLLGTVENPQDDKNQAGEN
jgi:hypothetical protein